MDSSDLQRGSHYLDLGSLDPRFLVLTGSFDPLIGFSVSFSILRSVNFFCHSVKARRKSFNISSEWFWQLLGAPVLVLGKFFKRLKTLSKQFLQVSTGHGLFLSLEASFPPERFRLADP